MYYTINENAARRAKAMWSWSDYVEGSATAEYRAKVDSATEIAETAKKRVEPEYHEKIDYFLDLYAKRLAENINRGFEIDLRCPSVMIAGGSNFPVRKKEKQNAARERNMQDYAEVEKLLDKIRSIGHGGIRSDDPRAIHKLRTKLEKLEQYQERMKAANAAIRLKDTVKGDAKLRDMGYTDADIKKLREPDFCGRVGYPNYELSNNNANIHRIRDRIAELERNAAKAAGPAGQPETTEGDGYKLIENTDAARIQFVFEDKPSAEIRELLKSYGFRWAPSVGAWQRLLNDNGRRAAEAIVKKL